MNNKKLWLWLSLHFGAGQEIYRKLYEHFSDIESIYDCDDADVNMIDWLKPHQKKKILDKNLNFAEEILNWCDYNNVNITTPTEPDYPPSLLELNDYPAVLYYLGKMPDFNKKLCISVVGTRKCTNEGQRNAYFLGFGLAKGGAIVVSGMALGIDCTAQKGALYAGGTAIAVLGSGIDVVYPRENKQLMDKIAAVGTVITEYPPHTPPNGYNFPVRNRIISALSPATVVVEGDVNSGALITANKAKAQGKKLFAYPGSVNTFQSSGNNQLLKDGAGLVTEAIDVLEQFMDVFPSLDLSASKAKPVLPKTNRHAEYYAGNADAPDEPKANKSTKENFKQEENLPKFDSTTLDGKERAVYDAIKTDKVFSADELSVPGIDFAEVASILTMLEVRGAIASIPGGYYVKK